jgi:hypothetical protein
MQLERDRFMLLIRPNKKDNSLLVALLNYTAQGLILQYLTNINIFANVFFLIEETPK